MSKFTVTTEIHDIITRGIRSRFLEAYEKNPEPPVCGMPYAMPVWIGSIELDCLGMDQYTIIDVGGDERTQLMAICRKMIDGKSYKFFIQLEAGGSCQSIMVLDGDPGVIGDRVIECRESIGMSGIVGMLGAECLILNQYQYMDLHLDSFWQEATGKTLGQTYCEGISGAHGDKAYGYKAEWAEAGIPFNHGVCIYMLTYYGRIFGETPRHTVADWVIDNYPKYRPMLEKVEREFFEALKAY